MKIVSVFAPKGGVAKTTTVLHLADCLSLVKGKQVLVYDSDEQNSLIESYYKEGDFSFDATGDFPKDISKYDYVIVDYSPTLLLSDKHRKLLKMSDAVVCPTDVCRGSLGSNNAVQHFIEPSKIINLFSLLDGRCADDVAFSLKHPDYFVVNRSNLIRNAMKACKTVFQSKSNSKYVKRTREQVTALVDRIESIKSIR
jgi:cellulose biosynthesis protein BcsQ